MADPLGAAASVIGIASFGIQIAQGLLQYYGSWKDQDSVILNMRASLSSLSRTLELLSETIHRRAASDKRIEDSVLENANRIKEIMVKLEDELKKIRDEKSPTKPGVRTAMRRHVRRLLYPFKEETLKKIQEAVSEARSNLDIALQVLQVEGISDVRQEIQLLVRWKEDKDTQNILNWLSPINFWLKQGDVRKQAGEGTGQWLLDHRDFLEWEKGNQETIWCLGSPGVGKTVLASTVIEFLEKDLPTHIGLAFVYCNHKVHLAQSLEYFLGAIIRQLVERRQVIPTEVSELYKNHCGKGTNATYNEYISLLQSIAQGYSDLYIVIDALDECIDKNGRAIWHTLLPKLKALSNSHLLYTSRDIEDIKDILSKSTRIEIRAHDTDIRSHVLAQIEEEEYLLQYCEEDSCLKDEIAQAIVSKADGIFLAAQLYIGFLSKKTNLRAVKKALSALPSTLDDNYEEAMNRIKKQHTGSLALKVLMWVVYAVRPLQLQEVQHAIAVDDLEPEDRSVTTDSLTRPSTIVNACAGLIRIDKENNVVALVHKTTQEYYDRNGIKYFPSGRRDIGMTCLKYLSLDVFDGYCHSDDHFERRLKENALLEYAARNLSSYIPKELGIDVDDKSLKDLSLKVFLDGHKVSCAMQVLSVHNSPWSWPRSNAGYSQDAPQNSQGLHYAAKLGLSGIVKLLLAVEGVDKNHEDSDGQTPLAIAAEYGHEDVVKLLLAAGADSNHKCNFGRTPLSYAAWEGHDAVVKLLLAVEGVDPESMDAYNETPLSYAAANGHDAVVKLLQSKTPAI